MKTRHKPIGDTANTFVGVDRLEYSIPPSLYGILESGDCIVEAARRYSVGDVKWKDLLWMLGYFPYFDPDMDINDYCDPNKGFVIELEFDPLLSLAKLDEAVDKKYLTSEEREEILNKRKGVVEFLIRKKRIPWQGLDNVFGPNGREIVSGGKHTGWESGGYRYSQELKGLLNRKQASEYELEFKAWQDELKVKRERDIHAKSFIGIDGVEYDLAPGLQEILEVEECITEACKRYSEGLVSWEDLKTFLVHFPYSKPHPDYALLTSKGNYYPDSSGLIHPRQFSNLNVCMMHGYLTKKECEQIDEEHDLLISQTTANKSTGRAEK